jgi:hypothetical protein
MGKHATQGQKIAFLAHLQHVHCAEAARLAGLSSTTAKRLKAAAGDLQVERYKEGLPPPTLEEQVAGKPGSRRPPALTVDQVTDLLKSCTLNKKQRKKLWHIVAMEEGFFDLHCCTFERKLRERGLRCCKSTKKLDLTDIQRASLVEELIIFDTRTMLSAHI